MELSSVDFPYDDATVELFRNHWRLHPELALRVLYMYAVCQSRGIPLRVLEGHRPLERQAKLYAQGRTAPGDIVTNAKPGQSKHNGMPSKAVDLGFPANRTRDVAHIGKSLGLKWGGDFKKLYDPPHFELP